MRNRETAMWNGDSNGKKRILQNAQKHFIMAAKYTMQEMNSLQKDGETLLYPRMIIQNCCSTEELARMVAKDTTFSAGEIKGIIDQLAQRMAWEMANGNSVKIEGIGTFTPSLSLKDGKAREEPDGDAPKRNAASIEVSRINFRPAKKLVQETDRHCRLERDAKKSALHVSQYTPEQRLEMAKQYLNAHLTMTVSEYAAMTGLSRTTASRELRKWLETNRNAIGIKGKGSHRVYVKPSGEDRRK